MPFDRLQGRLAGRLGWTRFSYVLIGGIAATLLSVVAGWWPLVVEYFAQWDLSQPFLAQVDWLLLFDFAVMFLLVMAGANPQRDGVVLLVGLAGGVLVESWGTRTQLWTYYTLESPPLWILPAWPVATLAIDRIAGWLIRRSGRWPDTLFAAAYWPLFLGFAGLLLAFAGHTLNQPLSLMAVALLLYLILTPQDRRVEVLTFLAGTGLGYFLERWGTTRACWAYYTSQTPPLFAVLAHGMAAVAFWRAARGMRHLGFPLARPRVVRAPE